MSEQPLGGDAAAVGGWGVGAGAVGNGTGIAIGDGAGPCLPLIVLPVA